MEELLKSTSLLGIQRLIIIILSVVRVKVSAVFLAPAGVGIVSQLSSFRSLIQQFVNLGVGSGITKYTAEYSGKKDIHSLERLLQTVTSTFIITGLLVLAGSLLFARRIAALVLADPSMGLLIILTGIAVPLLSQNEIISRCLQGMLKIRAMVALSIISSVVGLGITVPLVIWEGITGAVLSIALSALFSFGLGQFYLRRVALREHQIRLSLTLPDREIFQNLLRFGGSRGVIAVVEALTLLAIRRMLIERLGADSNGLYQVAFSLSNTYLAMLLTSVWSYGMPKVASMLEDPDAIADLQNDVMRLVLVLFVPLVVLILISKKLWIPILYSSAFSSAAPLLNWQLVGDIFRALGWAAVLTIVPKERFGFLIGSNILHYANRLIVFWLLLPRIGLQAAPVAYAVGFAINFPIVLFWQYKTEGFLYSVKNWKLIAKSIPVLVISLVLTSPLAGENLVLNTTIPLIALFIWGLSVFSLSDVERAGGLFQSFLKSFYHDAKSFYARVR